MWILLIPLSILIIMSCPRWSRAVAIKRWRRSLALDQHQSVYHHLYAHVDGFALSRDARRPRDAMEYVYGEIDFIPFIALLSLTKPDANTVFYDLGSGTGKAVLACAMVFNVRESHGVELFGSLHHAACQQQQSLARLPNYVKKAKTIYFTEGDFLQANVSNATLIFINATGFFGQTWDAISQLMEQNTHDLTVITTSKALKSKAFIVTKTTTLQMSWGIVTAYIQRRVKIS